MRKLWMVSFVLVIFGLGSCVTLNTESKISSRPDLRKFMSQIMNTSCNNNEKVSDVCHKVFYSIVKHHPNPEVRKLETLIREQRVILIFRESADATFNEWPREAIPDNQRPSDYRAYYPVLTMSPSNLTCIIFENNVLDLMVILDHEMVHYRQWAASDMEHRKVFRIYERATGLTKSVSPEACRDIWLYEKEAYLQTCRLLNLWQYGNYGYDDVCLYDNEFEFEHKLHRMFTQKIYRMLDECHSLWGKEIEK